MNRKLLLPSIAFILIVVGSLILITNSIIKNVKEITRQHDFYYGTGFCFFKPVETSNCQPSLSDNDELC